MFVDGLRSSASEAHSVICLSYFRAYYVWRPYALPLRSLVQ